MVYQNVFISKFDPENTDIKKKKKDPFFPFTWMTLNFSDPEMLVFSEKIIETRWLKQLVFLTIPKARHP